MHLASAEHLSTVSELPEANSTLQQPVQVRVNDEEDVTPTAPQADPMPPQPAERNVFEEEDVTCIEQHSQVCCLAQTGKTVSDYDSEQLALMSDSG